MESLQIILIAAGVACGLTTVLAALLVVAEKVLVHYGVCTLDVNAGARTLEVDGGQPLLSALRGEDIFIPSACGGRGTCAFCKLKITDGGGALLPTEKPLLTDEEIAADVRISCQVKIRNNMAIEIPEELFSVKQFRGRVERIRDLTHDIKELRIKLIDPETIEFTAGQYVQLETPAYGNNPEPVYRAYSLSGLPGESGHIELILRLVPGGICTTWVFTKLREGDEILLNGPYGDFHLSDTGREMIWIAGGSGMAPFWSMVRHMKAIGVQRRTRYFFGAVGPRDLFLVDELNELARELPWFEFIPALSGRDLDGWPGETGLITDVVGRHMGPGAELEGYLCGSGGMIDASVAVLTAGGVPDGQIHFDKFT